jgi:hypothetical protein
MPPKGLEWDTSDNPDTLLVEWEESELKGKVKHGEFAGYNVYRQEITDGGDNEFTGGPLNEEPIAATSYETPALRGRWKYTVTVVDILGNESAFAAPKPDLFVGEWEGAVYLTRGDLLALMRRLESMDKEKDEADDEYYEKIRTYIGLVQNFMRLGIPVTFRVEKKGGRYAATLIEIGYFDVEKDYSDNALLFKRSGKYSLTSDDVRNDGPIVKLTLKREDEFDERYSDTLTENGVSFSYTIRIRLTRFDEGSRDLAARDRKRKGMMNMLETWARKLEK